MVPPRRSTGPAISDGEDPDPALLVVRRREHRLGRREARDRDAERRAGDVVEADPLALVDRLRVAAMLAADPELDVGTRAPPLVDRDLHQARDRVVERLERVEREDPVLDVLEEE